MLSKNKIRFISALHKKKFRQKYNKFTVEGPKIVSEILSSDFVPELLLATEEWLDKNRISISTQTEVIEVTSDEMKKITAFSTPSEVLAVLHVFPESNPTPTFFQNGFHLALENIQDPGNLGTILRIADWFGIQSLILSSGCADFYNPKVLQASMGSFLRIPFIKTDFSTFFQNQSSIEIWGATLEGTNIFEYSFAQKSGIVIIGNESKGISPKIQSFLTQKLTIPRFGKAESLNAGVATGIICGQIVNNK